MGFQRVEEPLNRVTCWDSGWRFCVAAASGAIAVLLICSQVLLLFMVLGEGA